MTDLLKQRFRIITDFKSKFDTPEIKAESEGELNKILSKEIVSIECLNLMVESISRYCVQDEKYINKEHKKVLEKDLEVINEFLGSYKTLKQKKDVSFKKETLLEKGISLCTILTGFQRLWIEQWSKHLAQNVSDITDTDDYKRYRLIPGQHLFYYGAFTGTVTGKHSFATHHFVYVGKGLILEVGTDLVKGCLDVHTNPRIQPQTLLEKFTNPRSYKNLMSYFGLSTIVNAVKWAEKYGQNSFYIYEYPNDKNIDVIVRRLQRGEELIGKWMYSLFLLSNNCENAANYISVGKSLSTQACLGDMIANALQNIMSKVPFMSSTQKEIVEEGFFSPLAFETELKFMTDIPTCDKMNSYADRYISNNSHICIGSPDVDQDIETGDIIDSKCKIDKSTCETCIKEYDDIDPFKQSSKVCRHKKSKKKGKMYVYWD